jgi:hypothetical protein
LSRLSASSRHQLYTNLYIAVTISYTFIQKRFGLVLCYGRRNDIRGIFQDFHVSEASLLWVVKNMGKLYK